MTVDRDVRDRQAAEARLRERGWRLLRQTLYTPSGDETETWLVIDPTQPKPIANGSTWRMAASLALDAPEF